MSATATSQKTPASKSYKKTSNFREDGALTKQQVRILSFLAKQKSPAAFAAVAKADESKWEKTVRWAIGSISSDNRDPLSLVGRGLVKQVEVAVAGKPEHLYVISKSGQAALAKTVTAANGKK